MAILTTRLIPHHRQIGAYTLPSISILTTSIISNSTLISPTSKTYFHTTASLQRRGSWRDRNPKIGITLEQLRMAARGQGRRLPICHDEQEKVMNSLEAAKYENTAIYKYIMEYDKCREDYELNHKGKDKAMMRELNKYLVRKRK